MNTPRISSKIGIFPITPPPQEIPPRREAPHIMHVPLARHSQRRLQSVMTPTVSRSHLAPPRFSTGPPPSRSSFSRCYSPLPNPERTSLHCSRSEKDLDILHARSISRTALSRSPCPADAPRGSPSFPNRRPPTCIYRVPSFSWSDPCTKVPNALHPAPLPFYDEQDL